MKQIVIVSAIDAIADPIERALIDAGCSVRRFRDKADFLAEASALREAAVLVADGSVPVGRAAMEGATHLRAVISPFTGTEEFDVAAASGLNILVGNGQIPENYESMAEATIMLMLASLYDLPGRQAEFLGAAHRRATMLKGKVVGLLGHGRIAGEISRRLVPWGVRVIATARRPIVDPHVGQVDLEELLRASDLLCVLAPRNETTRMLLNDERMRQMRRGARLIVVSRGGIVDEAALASLAAEGHFAHVALDVFDVEPLPRDSPLRSLEHAILTPHSVGHTTETIERLPQAATESVLRVLRGMPPLYICNPEILETWRARWRGVQGNDTASPHFPHQGTKK
ncbi:NAD(P)-dependent oxidoreductase [Sphingobium sp.]|uniref:NAD(P)-dependent oxidoreductase n=1 Tax=Sphingobium sp. TaxID=1912891 RepID=UPI0028BDD26A|nr:NAD(P)-dependent oxidoreductase [Sphingobium sp.]